MTFVLLKSGRGRRVVLICRLVSVVAWFAGSYPRGMLMAYIDHACGHYEVKDWGLPPPWIGEYTRLLEEKYGVSYRSVGGCMVFPSVGWYADGYSSVSRPLLVRKYGKDIFAECAAAAEQDWRTRYPDKYE